MTTSKTLVIVESPAKCKKIESYLGSSQYKCVASFGHIRELQTKLGLKCIDLNTFDAKFQNVFRQRKHIANLKNYISSANEVIIATDDDREGEAIGWHLCQVFNLPIKTTKRIIFHEITKPALERAIQNPTTLNMDMIQSQQSRQILDLLVGYSVSPLLWKYIQSGKSSLSAGRCQTPALRIIYDNHREIQENPGDFTHSIQGKFNDHKYDLKDKFESTDSIETFLEKSKTHKHKIKQSEESEIEKTPPQPFTTSSIQQRASSMLHYSPKQTMMYCQNLYEAGYITYMRTDNKKYSKEFIDNTIKFINEEYSRKYVSQNIMSLVLNEENDENREKGKNKSKYEKVKTKSKIKGKNKNSQDNSENAQEAHEAIRPTNIDVEHVAIEGKITLKEKKMYELIRNNTLESCMSNAIYFKFLSIIDAPESKKYTSIFYKQKFDGWHVVRNIDESDADYHSFKTIKNNSIVKYDVITSNFNLINKTQHINEAKLVSLLESKGIGRPSTFSTIISKIQERDYVRVQDVEGTEVECTEYSLRKTTISKKTGKKLVGGEKKKLVIQPIGIMVIEFLIKYCNDLFVYEYTSNMESELDLISKKKQTKKEMCANVYSDIQKCIESIDIEDRMSFKIDENHTYKIGRYGPMVEYKNGDEVAFYKANENLDLDKLRSNAYSLDEVIAKHNSTDASNGNNSQAKILNKKLGKYNNKLVTLKNGKYGLFVTYDKKNFSLNGITKNDEEIKVDDVIPYIEKKLNPTQENAITQISNNKSIIRVLTPNAQLRKGQYGNYIYYQTPEMKKPKFINIKKEKSINFEKDEIDVIEEWLVDKI
jgi:DNA topoisomerase-1